MWILHRMLNITLRIIHMVWFVYCSRVYIILVLLLYQTKNMGKCNCFIGLGQSYLRWSKIFYLHWDLDLPKYLGQLIIWIWTLFFCLLLFMCKLPWATPAGWDFLFNNIASWNGIESVLFNLLGLRVVWICNLLLDGLEHSFTESGPVGYEAWECDLGELFHYVDDTATLVYWAKEIGNEEI